MTTINHHLNAEILTGYAAGTLPEAFNLLVATHISLCDMCRAELGALESIGGAMLDTEETVAVSDNALKSVFDLIERNPKDPILTQPPTQRSAVFPSPLQDYVGGDLANVKWRNVGGGVRQSVLQTSRDASIRLLSIPGGAAMPDHGHRGTEMTLVLQGAFIDDGERFGRGDVEIADEHLEHTPVAEVGQDCICLAATDAPLKFRQWLPRIAQPFVGI